MPLPDFIRRRLYGRTLSEQKVNAEDEAWQFPRGKGTSAAKGKDDIAREQFAAKRLQELGYPEKIVVETHSGGRLAFDPLGRDEIYDRMAPGWKYDEGRRAFLEKAAIGGGIGALIAAVSGFGGYLVGKSQAAPGDAIGGTTISPTDIDAKRIAGVRITTEFDEPKHLGTPEDMYSGSAIQAAIADLPASGGTVFTGNVNYACPAVIDKSAEYAAGFWSSIDLVSNLRLTGFGTLNIPNGTSEQLFLLYGLNLRHVQIEDLTFNLNQPNTSNPYKVGTFFWGNTNTEENDDFIIARCRFLNPRTAAIWHDGGLRNACYVDNYIDLRTNTGFSYGIAIHNDPHQSIVGGNRIRGNGTTSSIAILLDSCLNVNAVENIIDTFSTGIYLFDAAIENIVARNQILTSTVGIDLWNNDLSKGSNDRNGLIENIIHNPGQIGVRVDGDRNRIRGGSITDERTDAFQGLLYGITTPTSVTTFPTNTTVEGVEIHGYRRCPIRIPLLTNFIAGPDVWYSRVPRLGLNESPFDTQTVSGTGATTAAGVDGNRLSIVADAGSTNGGICYRRPTGSIGVLAQANLPWFSARARLVDTANIIAVVGLVDSLTDVPPTNGMYAKATGGANWQVGVTLAGAETVAEFGTGIAASTSFVDLIVSMVNDQGVVKVVGEAFDGSSWKEGIITTGLPTASLFPAFGSKSLGTETNHRARMNMYTCGAQTR